MTAHKILIVYASRYGQTAKIAGRIGNIIRPDHPVEVRAVEQIEASFHAAQYAGVIVAGAVYYDKHPRALRDFVREHAIFLATVPSAFVSVSGAAGAPTDEAKAQVKAYVDAFIAESSWTPRIIQPFAGGLAYSRYGFITKWIMRRLAKKRGRDYDTSRDYEYTDWNAVEEFATRFVAMIKGSR